MTQHYFKYFNDTNHFDDEKMEKKTHRGTERQIPNIGSDDAIDVKLLNMLHMRLNQSA